MTIQINCISNYSMSTIIHKNTPNSIRKKAQCRKTKLKRKTGQYFKEDAVCTLFVYLYYSLWSTGIILETLLDKAKLQMKILKNYNLNWRYISLESNFLVFNNWILNEAIINAFLVAGFIPVVVYDEGAGRQLWDSSSRPAATAAHSSCGRGQLL